MNPPLPSKSSTEIRAILDRDKWRCTATVPPREIRPGVWIPKELRRCSVMGSEMVVVNDRTYCPRHVPREDRDDA